MRKKKTLTTLVPVKQTSNLESDTHGQFFPCKLKGSLLKRKYRFEMEITQQKANLFLESPIRKSISLSMFLLQDDNKQHGQGTRFIIK